MGVLRVILINSWPLVPAIVYFVSLFKKKRIHPALLYLLACVVGYVVLLFGVWATDQYLEAKMNSFDLDLDGGIGGDELTPEADAAIDEWASDTGRAFAPVIGFPLTAIWTAMCFGVFYGGEWLIRKTYFRSSSNYQDSVRVVTEHRPDDDNPFHPPTNV